MNTARLYTEKDEKQYKIMNPNGEVHYVKSTNMSVENGRTIMFNQGCISAIIPENYLVIQHNIKP